MKNKVIELECMIGGQNVLGEPCKSIQEQMKEILEQNDNYDFVDLVYHPSNIINMKYASLICGDRSVCRWDSHEEIFIKKNIKEI